MNNICLSPLVLKCINTCQCLGFGLSQFLLLQMSSTQFNGTVSTLVSNAWSDFHFMTNLARNAPAQNINLSHKALIECCRWCPQKHQTIHLTLVKHWCSIQSQTVAINYNLSKYGIKTLKQDDRYWTCLCLFFGNCFGDDSIVPQVRFPLSQR